MEEGDQLAGEKKINDCGLGGKTGNLLNILNTRKAGGNSNMYKSHIMSVAICRVQVEQNLNMAFHKAQTIDRQISAS